MVVQPIFELSGIIIASLYSVATATKRLPKSFGVILPLYSATCSEASTSIT